MALTKDTSAQSLQASASNTAGSTTTSSAATVAYGASIVAQVTNGATGPTVACDAVLQVSADNSTWFEYERRTAPTSNNGTLKTVFNLGVAGLGGDWKYARVQFTGNTAQAVTVQADASTTTALT